MEQLLTFGSGACKAADPSPARGVQQKVRRSSHSSAYGRSGRRRRGGRGASTKEQPVAKLVHLRRVGAMKAFRLVQFVILLGTRMQTVKSVEEDISIRQELGRTIETDLVPQLIRPADRSTSLRRTGS